MARLKEVCVLCFILCKTILCVERFVSSPVGSIKGLTDTITFDGKDYTYSKFLGIPYAESTDGDRRFRKPVKKQPFRETYDATEEKLVCVQNSEWNPYPPPSGEDCLNLNIFVPDNAAPDNPKPVMLFIYGGGFQEGYQNSYGIGALPVVNDIVYVTINYRVNIFGFLSHTKYGLEGNYGLWDQHMSIQWVHDNIASFGGDPNHVTIFGESAGGASVTYQALYEGNVGLFQRFIAESGVTGMPWSYTSSADDVTERIIQAVGCDDDSIEGTVQCLQMKSVDEIVGVIGGEYFLPLYDGDFVKYYPAKLYDTSLESSRNALTAFSNFDAIIGVNSNESALELYYPPTWGFLNHTITFPDDLTPELATEFLTYSFNTMDKKLDESIINLMAHQYTDWTDPRNPSKINEQIGALMSDYQFIAPAIKALHAHSQSGKGKGTYMYYFEHRPSYSSAPEFIKGASHADEIPFVLGFPESYLAAVGANITDVTHSEIVLSTTMMRYWSQFARTGNPNMNPAMATWPRYNVDTQKYTILNTVDTPHSTGQYLRRRQVHFWNNVLPNLEAGIEDREMCETSSKTFMYPSVCLLVNLIMLSFI